MTEPAALFESIREEVGEVLVGNRDLVEHLTVALLTRGHVLLEGVPGVAKTTLAHLLANATGLSYSRIQMTPDLLPADITGTNVYSEEYGTFELQKGPVFSNLVVADEINRATPKTQSALLEAMQEGQVSIEGTTLELPDPFMVIATRNPIEMEGTFELPEAQRDRFQLNLVVDLPDYDDEAELLDRFDGDPTLGPAEVEQVVSTEAILDAREVVTETHVVDAVQQYVLDLVRATRAHPDVAHGASPRAAIHLQNAAKARARIHGREYAIPDDVKALAGPVLGHRLILTTEAEIGEVTTRAVVDDVRSSVAMPDPDPDVDADGDLATDDEAAETVTD